MDFFFWPLFWSLVWSDIIGFFYPNTCKFEPSGTRNTWRFIGTQNTKVFRFAIFAIFVFFPQFLTTICHLFSLWGIFFHLPFFVAFSYQCWRFANFGKFSIQPLLCSLQIWFILVQFCMFLSNSNHAFPRFFPLPLPPGSGSIPFGSRRCCPSYASSLITQGFPCNPPAFGSRLTLLSSWAESSPPPPRWRLWPLAVTVSTTILALWSLVFSIRLQNTIDQTIILGWSHPHA